MEDVMAKKNNGKTTVFDQKNQTVGHQVNIAGGDNQTNKVSIGANQEEIFAQALEFISKSQLSEGEKVQVTEKVKLVEKEIAKGDAADPSILETLLKAVIEQLPELATIILTAILNPAAGIPAGIVMVAKQVLKIS